MRRDEFDGLLWLLVFVTLALLASFATSAAPLEGMRALAELRGCSFCHREAPAAAGHDALPIAPSWREIAARYGGRPGAEAELIRVVMEGANPAERHWTRRVEFAAMRGNAGQISADEARTLVRWILAAR
jgi:cytochrome c